MRSKPIQRDEVRFDGRRITTMPADSGRKNGLAFEPIAKLWAPLLRSLKITTPLGQPDPLGPYTCRHCGRKFHHLRQGGGGTPHYCSDQCAGIAHQAAVSKSRSEQRALERADRACATCGKPITAKRSTMRFCSVKCRVAAHRSTASPDT
jgi:endogenous inhibitor of DNA gyrase (YacG/DUF329 family)